MSHKHFKKTVEDFLKTEPKFRERKNKDKGNAILLLKRVSFTAIKNAIQDGHLNRDDLIRFCQDHASMDRAWRQALEHDPSLRGSDYGKKEVLEQEREIELGYSPGHEGQIRKLKTL